MPSDSTRCSPGFSTAAARAGRCRFVCELVSASVRMYAGLLVRVYKPANKRSSRCTNAFQVASWLLPPSIQITSRPSDTRSTAGSVWSTICRTLRT